MERRFRSHALVVAAMATLLFAACSDDTDDEPTPPDPSSAETDANGTGEEPAAEDDPAADEPDEPEASGHLQGSVQVDREQTNSANVSVRISQITAEGNGVYVDIEAFNGSSDRVLLAWNAPSYIRVLVDDDTGLAFQPPEDNPQLEVPPSGELTARLAFVGRIPSSAESLTLQMNWGDEGSVGMGTVVPGFEFTDLPVPSG